MIQTKSIYSIMLNVLNKTTLWHVCILIFMIAFGNQPEKLNLRWLISKAGDQRSWKCRRGSTTNGKMSVVMSVGEIPTYFNIICVLCLCLKVWSVAFIYFFVCGEKGLIMIHENGLSCYLHDGDFYMNLISKYILCTQKMLELYHIESFQSF